MINRFRQPVWVVPLVIAGLVAVFGWWANLRLRHTVEQQVRAELTGTLDANVTALEIWMTNQTKLATSLADEGRVRALANVILQKSYDPAAGRDAANAAEAEEFGAYLRPRLTAVGYQIAELVNTNFAVVANSRRAGFNRQVPESHTNQFAELFASGQPVIITPYKPEFLRGFAPRGGRSGQAQTNRVAARRGDITLMQVAAPVRNNGIVMGALAMVINPDHEFTRILSVARSGESGETYAFDQTGLLISRSRFDEQLKKLGLLDETNTSSALNLRLHDPQGKLVDGAKPLIHIVARAVAGDDGVDVNSSRDYRGVDVVGAWRWLPDHGFGVATQIDAREAYQPLRVLKLIFLILFVLLLLCANGMFLFSYSNLIWRRRLGEAELMVRQLGQYTLEEKIGEGGMGVVYRARHALMRRDTAVKLLLPDVADPAAVQRFEREVCLTCQLTHPNTIQVYDYGHTPEGIFYFAMEFLRGLNLHELTARYGPQPEGRVIHILAQVCDSLAEAHTLGLVHRDIKPANIFLCDRGGVPDCVKVLDFGLVREYGDGKQERTRTTGLKGLEGTPWFMAPESIKDSGRSDPRSDIYSVGALGYYLLTGEFVFDSESVRELCEKHLKVAPPPPGQRTTNPISAPLESIILRCLEKDTALRPQSAPDLRALLLASPHASEWTAEARAAWWAEYHAQAVPKPGETEHPRDGAVDVSVSVDFASRMK
jgi:hypothetical protein